MNHLKGLNLPIMKKCVKMMCGVYDLLKYDISLNYFGIFLEIIVEIGYYSFYVRNIVNQSTKGEIAI